MDITQEILDIAAADPYAPEWASIWASQPGDPTILPWLDRTCAALRPGERIEALALAGVITRSAGPETRAAYAPQIRALHRLAAEDLTIETFPDHVFVRLQMAELALSGEQIWSSELSVLTAGEADIDCPHCATELLLCLEPGESTIEPGLSSPLAHRLHTTAVQTGHPAVADSLTRLFGRFTCPGCHTTFPVADQVAA